MIQAWSHSVLLQKLHFPTYLNAQGIISLLKWGQLHEDGQRLSWRERKICSCTRRCPWLNQGGTAWWLIRWKAFGPGRTGEHLSNRSQISLSNASQDWFCFPSGVSVTGKRLKGLWMKPSTEQVTLPDCAGDARLHIPLPEVWKPVVFVLSVSWFFSSKTWLGLTQLF